MPRRSAASDLKERTLGSLPGFWAKLFYFARLRRGKKYEHWGIVQKYGAEGEKALADGHAEAFQDTLRSSVVNLEKDAQQGPGVPGKLGRSESIESLLPPETKEAPRAHFRYLVTAVRELLKKDSHGRPRE